MVLRAVNRRARQLAFFLGLLACALFMCALYWGTMNARSSDLREARIAVQNMANALSKQVNSSLRIAEAVLDGVSDMPQRPGHPNGVEAFRSQALLFEEVDTIALFNARGKLTSAWPVIAPANWDVSKEAFFDRALAQGSVQIAIGAPMRSAITGEMIIPIYKRYLANGEPGVALVGVKLSYLSALFDSFDVKGDGALVLASSDGVMLLRRPYDVQFLGKSMANASVFRDFAATSQAGWATIVSSQDGIKRINYYQHVPSYPLFVVAALSYDEVLAGWRHIMAFILALAVVAACAIGVLVCFLQRLLRYKEKAEHDIDEANRALAVSNERLAEQALLDGLTGIANRRALDEEMQKAIQSASRSNAPLGVVMLDVDHFKRFNDIYGHIQGDYCLKDLGSVLKAMQKRVGDLAGRYGGEEFVIVLPNTDMHGAYKVAEDVLNEVRQLQIPHRGNAGGCVTVSAGVTSFVPFASSSVEEFYALADRALYAAKNSGRNKVCDSSSLAPPTEDVLADAR